MIYYYLICFLIAFLIIAIIINSKTKEHYVNEDCSTKKTCENNFGPMDRPNNQPSCFFYDIDTQNEQLYGALNQTALQLDGEIVRSLNIDHRLSTIANEYNTKLNTLMQGPIVSGIKQNLNEAAALLASAIENNTINVDIELIYKFNPQEMEQLIQTAIELYIQNILNNLIRNANINFETAVAGAIRNHIRNNVTVPVINQFLRQFNENSYNNILTMLRTVIQQMNVRQNIQGIFNNSVRNNPQISNFVRVANENQINIGDFVYFRHRIPGTINEICVDNNAQSEIIVGGRVCNVNNVNQTVRISYNYVMNPNRNQRCNGSTITISPSQSQIGPISPINYDNAPDGLPKWYPQTPSSNCGANAPRNLACRPSQWRASDDNWVRTWIGQFDRASDQMLCAQGPPRYGLPIDVPMSILSRNVELLLSNCQDVPLFTISNPAIPTLSLTNFPALGNMSNWEMNINFNVNNNRQGSWRPLIGDMYNRFNNRGWGVWVSPDNNIHFSWQSLTWNASPRFNIVLNTNYNLRINRTPNLLSMVLTNLNNQVAQTVVYNSINNRHVMTTNGPVTIGGWIQDNGERFPGTISRITVI